jgi:hypothetical protein
MQRMIQMAGQRLTFGIIVEGPAQLEQFIRAIVVALIGIF